MDLSGRTLGHYRVLEEISRGGMGVVYRALDTRLNREVALKVLRQALVDDADRRQRFLQEAQAASSLEHPHIAVIHAVDEIDSITFIAMELIRGTKLSDLLVRQPLPVARALDLAVEIAGGLARAHERHMVHRDLKPANVMVTDEGHAKIIDFGIAKLIEPAGDPAAETRAIQNTGVGVVLGTTPYMSPEQARGDKVDHRSDIFSFGIVLHEMLSGRPPFGGKSSVETAGAILHAAAPRLPELEPAASGAADNIQRIVDKCLAKDPDNRYQGMKDVAVDLRAARRRLESTSAGVPIAHAGRSFPWRWIAAGSGGIAVVALALLWIGPRVGPDTAAPSVSPSSKPSVAVLYFDNTTGASELDWMRTGVTEMVVTDLSQSPDLEVISTDALYQVLAELGRADDRITSPDVVNELAARIGISNVVVGSYIKAGDVIRITARLQDVKTGRIVTSERVEGQGEASLFAMVDDLSQRIRARFETMSGRAGAGAALLKSPGGETAAPSDRPVGDVTTNSIEAYRHYAEGSMLHDRHREADAAAAFKQAVAIDPGFAMAYLKLAVTSANLANFGDRDKYAQLAMERTDRVTPRERFYIQGYAYGLRPATLAQSIDAYERCLALDAGHVPCRHNLALSYGNLTRFGEAIAHGEELRRRGLALPVTYGNLMGWHLRMGQVTRARTVVDELVGRHADLAFSQRILGQLLIAEGRYDEAIAALGKAQQIEPRDPFAHGLRGIAEFLGERWDALDRTIAALTADPDPTFTWFGLGLTVQRAMLHGRGAEALDAAARGAQVYPKPGVRSAESRLFAARVRLLRAQPAEALREAEQARRDVLNQNTEMNALAMIAVVQDRLGRRVEADRTLTVLDERVRPFGVSTQQVFAHSARGRIALQRGDAAAAVRELGQAQAALSPSVPPGELTVHLAVWAALAEAHMAAGNDAEALRAFQRITELGHERFVSPVDYVRSFYFLARLYEKRGDTSKAREAYARFFHYWKDGDLERDRVAEAQRKIR